MIVPLSYNALLIRVLYASFANCKSSLRFRIGSRVLSMTHGVITRRIRGDYYDINRYYIITSVRRRCDVVWGMYE